MDLLALLKSPEGKTLEFKRDLSSPENVLRTVVAFANTSGGTILIGVEDRTRNIRGVPDPLEVEERLANLISDNIIPRLVPELEILPWRRGNIVALQVYPSGSRPHYLKSFGAENGVFVRVGSTNRRADREFIEELRRFSRNESYDERPMPELDLEAIDFKNASDQFASIRKLKHSDMETLRLAVRHQGRIVPTVGGILLFGKDRKKFFPDAWIQAGRFRGTDRRHISDSTEINAPLVTSIDEAIAFVRKHISEELVIEAVRRKERWTVPKIALRETIINAVAHTDYSQRGAPIRISIFDDRIEVENPGVLPSGLTVDDIRRGISKIRNRVIGRVFHGLGLIEQWGSGIQRMTAACRESGLDEPDLEEIGIRFRVTLFTVPKKSPKLDEIDRAVMSALSKGKGLSTQEISTIIHRSARATRLRLLSLIERGLIKEIGSSPMDPRRRYYLAG